MKGRELFSFAQYQRFEFIVLGCVWGVWVENRRQDTDFIMDRK